MSLDEDNLEPTEEETLLAAADAEIDELSKSHSRPIVISEINKA
jgi:hypothetical protein